MAKASRDKGARGEREIIDLLQPIVDTAYKAVGKEPPRLQCTSSLQADGGGCDVHGLPGLALEVKRCETLQIESWWRQCVQQSKAGQLPVLVYRQNGRKWIVRLLLQIAVPSIMLVVADIAIEAFAAYFAACLRLSLNAHINPATVRSICDANL